MSDLGLYAREAELAITAALFSESATQVYEELALTLRGEDFYFAGCRAVFVAVEAMVAAGKPLDRTLILTHIKATAGLSDNLKEDIALASSEIVATDNVKHYAEAVVEKSAARKLSNHLAVLQKKTNLIGGELSAKDVLSEFDAVSLSMDRRSSENKLLDEPGEALTQAIGLIESITTGDNFGVWVGLTDLDEKLSGMLPGDFVIVGGRPSMGKTAFVLSLCLNHGIRLAEEQLEAQGKEFNGETAPLIAVFSLEMETRRLIIRMMSNLGRIPHDAIRKGVMSDAEWSKMTHAMSRYNNCDIRIDDDGTLTPAIMRAKLRMLVRRTGKPVSLIVIDYLQLMDSDGTHQNRTQELSDISRKLKKLGKEFGCPVVALTQLNRKLEERPNKRPVMSDIRESGSIEQDADTIIFLYRDEYYNPDSADKGTVEIILAKGRDVGTGISRVKFEGQYQSFDNFNSHGNTYETKYHS